MTRTKAIIFVALASVLSQAAQAQELAPPSSSGLVAVGRLPANLKDKFSETFGSGSGMAAIPGSWKRAEGGFTGELWLLPDRGYNVEGTTDYRTRLNRLSIKLLPGASGAMGRIEASLADTILLTDEAGVPMSGLDPVAKRSEKDGWPAMPMTAGGKISLDPEAVVLLPDGGFMISDEYGPAIYRFAGDGKLLSTTQPPAALLPKRKGAVDFSSNNPAPGAPVPSPKDPELGRQNNQGFEGMALSPDGKELTVVLQSAARQDGGDNAATRQHTRALVYDASDVKNLKLIHEAVVPLPTFVDDGKTKVAAQSEIVWIGPRRYLMLSRDSNNGYGQKGAASLYRQITVLDLNGSTNIAGTQYDVAQPIAPKGVLADGIKPAALSPFIDINDAAELAKAGLHNGAPNDRTNLSEKWEAMTLFPTLEQDRPDEFYLFVANDNDFITQDGFQVGAAYKDASGADVDTMFLVYRVKLPGAAKR